jgi:putative ABC transport system permease protein
MSVFLAFKEIARNRGRFFLISLVIALITILVLFIAGLAEGLATANRQFIQKLQADLLVYQENTDLSTSASRLDLDKLHEVQQVDGVKDAGLLGLSTASLVFPGSSDNVGVSLVGVQIGKPGDPTLLSDNGLTNSQAGDVLVDETLAEQNNLKLGDTITLKSIQGTTEELFTLTITGITEQQRYFFQPSLILPIEVWDEIRPQASTPNPNSPLIGNVIAVELDDPTEKQVMITELTQQVSGIEPADKKAAILAIPGYSAQQSTLNTQRIFTLLIGVLVVGGFFQIQTLQKIPQIGMLKAIGSSNRTVGSAALLQITMVTILGVLIGTTGTLLLALGLPGNVPIIFNGTAVLAALISLLLIGPIGGFVSVRLALRVDPLTAISQSA